MPRDQLVLLAGYALAVPFSVYPPGFRRLWRRREPLPIVAEELGAALITAGWLMRRKPVPAAVNAAWGVGLLAAYVVEGRRRRRSLTS